MCGWVAYVYIMILIDYKRPSSVHTHFLLIVLFSVVCMSCVCPLSNFSCANYYLNAAFLL